MKLSTYLIFGLFLLAANSINSQVPRGGGAPDSGSTEIEYENPADTIPPEYYTKKDPGRKKVYTISAVDSVFVHQYDFSKMRSPDYIHIGNQGSSAFPIQSTLRKNISYDLGFHQFDIYRNEKDELKYLTINNALSDLYFSPNGKGNFIVKAIFANSFKNNIDLSIDYHRINETGAYQNAKTKNTALSAGLAYDNKKAYRLFAEFHVNNHNENYNGGVSDTTLFNERFNNNRMNIPVYLTDASSRYEDFSYDLYHHLRLGSDSSAVRSTISLHSNYNHGYNRYYDDEISGNDTEVYGNYLLDDRGIRQRLSFKRISNDFSFDTQLKNTVQLKLGASVENLSLDNELEKENFINSIVYGNTKINLTEEINLSGKVELGLGDIAGNIGLKTRINLPIKKIINLDGGFNFNRSNPTHIQNQLVITQLSLWTNNFSKPIETELWARLGIPKIKTKIKVSQIVTDNAIYLNEDNTFDQSVDIFSSTSVEIEQALKLGIFNLNHYALFQRFNENLYNLPDLYVKQSFFINFNLFKKNLGNEIGVEHRFISNAPLPRFNPILGQLYYAGYEKKAHSSLDLFALFKVSQFRFLVRAENFLDLFSDEIYYPIYRHPAYDFNIRIAARWLIRK